MNHTRCPVVTKLQLTATPTFVEASSCVCCDLLPLCAQCLRWLHVVFHAVLLQVEPLHTHIYICPCARVCSCHTALCMAALN
jgi:hypothetical protein